MRRASVFLLGLAICLVGASARGAQPRLEAAFAHPPEEAKPWVYWFWSDGNITRAGITADLEAMKRVGIGGVLIMEVDQGAIPGLARFMSQPWRELFAFAAGEAVRLGLKINLNNDAGWTGSGGPWITAEQSMQKVVWKEQRITGPARFDAAVEQPEAVEKFYRDIAVLAFPTPPAETAAGAKPPPRIDKFAAKSGLGTIALPDVAAAIDARAVVDRGRILDLTARFRDGRLTWDVPAGDWTIVRFGHTSTGKPNYPSPTEGRGLEVDKLSRAAVDRHYDAFVGTVIKDIGAKGGPALTTVHVDSWEVGFQNWTTGFGEAFRQRRGYDLVPWLPAFTGRAIESAALTERFLWDVRRTISELLNENYAQRFAERAHETGRRFSLEGYSNGPFDCLSYTGRSDLPIAEFWTTRDPTLMHASVKTMTSAGHIYGKNLIAAEAFTANDANGRQRNHPYTLKAIGDAAFCAGINQFIFHRYSLQPWIDERKPGMTMGPWGVEYERTATWWEQTKPWHEYLARCQQVLRQGRFVADLCYLQSEEGINNPANIAHLKPAVPAGYDFDFCSDEVVRTRMTVKDGRLVLSDGMSYRVLVLPEQRLMTPALLRKIREFVQAGAVVIGAPPLHSPSLSGYPECDQEVKQLVAELWGNSEGPQRGPWTKGTIAWGATLEEVLARIGAEPDFAFRAAEMDRPPIRSIHRTLPDREIYFVANLGDAPTAIVASFRVAGAAPELWHADRGAIEPVRVFDFAGGRTRVPLSLEPRGSVFVVFRRTGAPAADRVIAVKRNGSMLIETGAVSLTPPPPAKKPFVDVRDTFTFAVWVKPMAETTLPKENVSGTGALSVRRNDVVFPPPGHEVFTQPDSAGAGLAVGTNGITVLEHGDHHFVAPLVYPAPIKAWTHVAVVFERGAPRLYVNGELVRTGRKTAKTVHGGVGVPHSREVRAFNGEHSPLQQFARALTPAEIRDLMQKTPKLAPVAPAVRETGMSFATDPVFRFDAQGRAWVAASGRYELARANGRGATGNVESMPATLSVAGPWILRFPSGGGAPPEVTLPKLISWSDHETPGVRYFSGTATYRTAIELPAGFPGADRRALLDLGGVQVIAEVKLNGRELGTLWRPPFQIEATHALQAGRNELEIRVTNLWVNRLIGDEQLPADREWTTLPRRNGWALKAYPDWLLRGERSPTGRITFATWKHYEADAPLLPSGLLGPVTIRTLVKLPLGGGM